MYKVFDSHFHIIDPAYPLAGNQGFTPDYFTVEQYRNELAGMGVEAVGSAVVSGSFQGYDQSYFEGALGKLGSTFVGVTQLDPATSDEEILRLDKLGIKAIRFNLFRGLSATLEDIEEQGRRVRELCGWKTELYLDASKMDDDFVALVLRMPDVSIDHLGMRKGGADLMKKFVAAGVPVRVTGFGRIDYTREEAAKLIAELYAENPKALIFGSDLPSTRASKRFDVDDIELIVDAVGSDHAEEVLYGNGAAWYLGA